MSDSEEYDGDNSVVNSIMEKSASINGIAQDINQDELLK